MRKLTLLLALFAVTAGNCAQPESETALTCTVKRKKDTKEQPCPQKEFAWGLGLVGLAVIGAVVGCTAGMASSSSN